MSKVSKDSMTADLIKSKFKNPTMVTTLTKSMSPDRERQLLQQISHRGENQIDKRNNGQEYV